MGKPDCSKHKDHIEGFEGSMEDLAEKLGDLRYDTLIEFLEAFEKKLKKDADKDQGGGRVKLASSLYRAQTSTKTLKAYIEDAWKHSKPYMDV